MRRLMMAAALAAVVAAPASAQPWNCGAYGGVYGVQNRLACERDQAADPFGYRRQRLEERVRAADEAARHPPAAPPPATYRRLDGQAPDFTLR